MAPIEPQRRWSARSAALAAAALALGGAAPPAGAADPERGRLDAGPKGLARVPAEVRKARTDLRERFGRQGLLSVDAATGAVRFLARLDGFLTRPRAGDAAGIVRDYVGAHADVLGLEPGDARRLGLAGRERSGRLERLTLTQSVDGVPLIDSALRAHVASDGRLLALTGALRPDPRLETTRPKVARDEALAQAAQGVAPTGSGYRASLVAYERGVELRLGWRVLVHASSTAHYDTIVDAESGAVVRRVNRVKFGTAPVFDNHPGAAAGGTAVQRELSGYLAPNPTRLFGPNVHAFVDHDDVVPGPDFDAVAPPTEEETTPTDLAFNFDYPFGEFVPGPPGFGCSSFFRCSWDHKTPGDWDLDRNQAATQLFWFVNTFHDHLEGALGIGFSDGNFEGADRVIAQAQDGADTGTAPPGFPDQEHANNANMLVLPDGSPALMQAYLWDPVVDPEVRPVHGGDDASLVYHEYAHGLTNRLLTDAEGYGALNGAQAGAIDEGSADWYALDYLVDKGLTADGGAPDLTVAGYTTTSPTGIRTQPIDCVSTSAPASCPDAGAGPRGYTYGDFGLIHGGPEVHDDGEIWAQTLWQLRERLIGDHPADGVIRARRLVTNGLRLAPTSPSFLDMRNAILLADTQAAGGDRAAIWDVFAARGMGYAASTRDTDDVRPVEDFNPPPGPDTPVGDVVGTVRDGDTGAPLADALVGFAGHDSGLGEDLSGRTAPDGSYRIENVPARSWDYVSIAPGAGYDRSLVEDVAVGTGTTTLDLTPRRNWALASGGAKIASFTGPDYGPQGCGPGGLIDGTRLGVWGTVEPGPKEIVVHLPESITVDEVWIDPSAGCGDAPAAALSAYQIQTSPDGATYSVVGAGTFGPEHAGQDNAVPLSSRPADVGFVKLRALTNQGDPSFLDVAELRVLGHRPTGPSVPTGPPSVAAITAPSPAGARSSTRLRLVTRRATLTRRGAFVWNLVGPARARASARFTATLGRASAARRRTLARKRFRIAASGRGRVVVRLSRRTRRRLGEGLRLRVTASARAGDLRASSRFVLRVPRRRATP